MAICEPEDLKAKTLDPKPYKFEDPTVEVQGVCGGSQGMRERAQQLVYCPDNVGTSLTLHSIRSNRTGPFHLKYVD